MVTDTASRSQDIELCALHVIGSQTLLKLEPSSLKSQWNNGEDARAAVSYQQMKVTPRYPVDRYLVEGSMDLKIDNILNQDLWKQEPALRPEEEMMLRKLHEMLQSTADDLKLLSGELKTLHDPNVRLKTTPIPQDEEFSEKVHIEEIVDAKFHGYKIIDKPPRIKVAEQENKYVITNDRHTKTVVNSAAQTNKSQGLSKSMRNLSMSGVKTVQIHQSTNIKERVHEETKKDMSLYKEISYQYPEAKEPLLNTFVVQEMPKINIRSELIQQKVLQIDIIPEDIEVQDNANSKQNVAVISVQHEKDSSFGQARNSLPIRQAPVRKYSKIGTCESSESTNNVSSERPNVINLSKQRATLQLSARSNQEKTKTFRKSGTERKIPSIDKWKKKLEVVYGQSASGRRNSLSKYKVNNIKRSIQVNANQGKTLNNVDYIPYSLLTLGGVRVSDIERELSDINNDVALSPILDKIVASKENSFNNESPRKKKKVKSPKIFTTSDENLLQEVIDIEKTVSETLSKSLKNKGKECVSNAKIKESKLDDDSTEEDKYIDDFEDDKSYVESENANDISSSMKEESEHQSPSDNLEDLRADNEKAEHNNCGINKKSSSTRNLSFKNSVDVFEFVHLINTQESSTQSASLKKILKETQTSPRNEKPVLQPIRNDLWPIDPRGEIENMFKLEKDFIKQIILEEYADLIEKNVVKPSTSNHDYGQHNSNNTISTQKNTQTSPANVKSIMTSPTRTKTSATSPFAMSLNLDHHAKSMLVYSNEDDHLRVEIDNSQEDLGISINLSSPRFSLRLPQTSREVISNLNASPVKNKSFREKRKVLANKKCLQNTSTSTSSEDEISTELSSLGEVNLKLNRRLRKIISSEDTNTSLLSKCSSESGGILPLKSEGEISLQTLKKLNTCRKVSGLNDHSSESSNDS